MKFTGRITLFFILCSFGLLPGTIGAQEGQPGSGTLHENVRYQLKILAQLKSQRTEAQKKMSSSLLHTLQARRGVYRQMGLAEMKPQMEVAGDETVLLDIKATVTPDLLARIEALGGMVINSFAQYDAIRARIPIGEVETLAALGDIRHLGPPEKYLLNKINTSEGDVAHNAAAARNKYSLTGRGVKVGVLSDSVDHLGAVQASGDLPSVNVLSNSPGFSGEGTAMLEIIHDLAPEAELYFATALPNRAAFAGSIQSLANAGCRVIIDDIGYLDESPFQDDIVSQAVNSVTSRGALYFSAAGNGGNFNDRTSGVWEGDYQARATVLEDPDYDSVHDFGGGQWGNRITAGTPFCYTLFWADPLGGSANDYDLFLVDPTGTEIVLASTGFQDGNDDPLEGICPDFDTTGYYLLIARYGGGAGRFMHLNTNLGRLQYQTPGQIKGHQAAANAFAVAAVSARNRTVPFVGTEKVETFSSDGPRRIFFNPDGSAITPGNFSSTGGMLRFKPDIAAADGVRTATPGFNPFYGTSAAAPHAGAIAALMLSGKPGLSIADVRQAFKDTALDIEAAGWDRDSGWGIIMADRVLESIGPFGRFNPAILHLLLGDEALQD